MNSQWYYSRDGKTLGPVSAETLQSLSRHGELNATDLLWRDGMPDWVEASSIGLGAATAAHGASIEPPPAIVPPPVVSRNSIPPSRPTAATYLAFAFGGVAVLAVGVIWFLAAKRDQPTRNTTQATRDLASRAGASSNQPPVSTAAPAVAAGEPAVPVPQPTATHLVDVSGSTKPVVVSQPASPAIEEKENSSQPGSTNPTPQADSVNQPAPPPLSRPVPKDLKTVAVTAPTTAKPRTFFQQVEIARSPRFSIQDLEMTQNIRYLLLSRLDVEPPANGRRKVVQFVQDAKLLAADDLSREAFTRSLERLRKQQYTYTLSEQGEVLEFTGHKDNATSLPIDLPAAAGFAITSVIDQDGWKELAELTFLQPDPQVATNKPWRRQMTHDWGALGGWSGMTTFTKRGKTKGIQEFEYKHEMKYSKAAAATPSLPFKIVDAEFEPKRAGGKIEFDTEKQRVRLAQEVFEVQGIVAAELLGQTMRIYLTEQQLIEIRVSEQAPGPIKQ